MNFISQSQFDCIFSYISWLDIEKSRHCLKFRLTIIPFYRDFWDFNVHVSDSLKCSTIFLAFTIQFFKFLADGYSISREYVERNKEKAQTLLCETINKWFYWNNILYADSRKHSKNMSFVILLGWSIKFDRVVTFKI